MPTSRTKFKVTQWLKSLCNGAGKSLLKNCDVDTSIGDTEIVARGCGGAEVGG